MSLPIPLTVRVSGTNYHDGSVYAFRIITDRVRDLSFRWTDPGGFSTCTVSVSEPLNGQPDYIGFYGTLTISDARTGYTVWEGRLEDPARKVDGSQGQVWELSAIGGMAYLRDEIRSRCYVDTTFSGFQRVANLAPFGDDAITDDPGGSGKDAMVLRFPNGSTLATGTAIVMRHERLKDASQSVALVSYSWDFGGNDAGCIVESVLATSVSSTQGDQHAMTSTPGTGIARLTTNFPASMYRVEFKYRRTGASLALVNDLYWLSIMDPVIVAARTDRHGTQITDGTLYNPYVLAHEIVEDLLGNLSDDQIDSNRAIIDTNGTTQIKQLVYVDGADPEAILTDLMALQDGYTWRVWEKDPVSEGHVFEWVTIPTSVRYEADVIDGYDSNSSSSELYNGVTVRWRDAKGAPRSATYTNYGSQSPLNLMGRFRTAQIELSDEVGSESIASTAAQNWLADRQSPPNAGRLRIARPIKDLGSGRMVQPWEIRPGLIRVRGVLPRPDAINATSRDGITVFRIIACEYNADDGAATLELDSYPPSMSALLGRIGDQSRSGGKRRDWLNKPIRRS